MGRRIELPKKPSGKPEEQLNALYSYLYQMAEALNSNLEEIGGNDLTDSEMMIVRDITGGGEVSNGWEEMETLKSLIIKTAKFVKNESDIYRTKLLGDYVAEGKFGKYVRHTGLDVDVTPTGITQNYTFEEIVQGLKTYEVNAKNYIKTGLLRTVSSVPVYGVAIGKDVVTFSNDGTETYNDGNKVAELTADELSFWQSGNKIASYTGTSITLYSGTSKRVVYDATGTTFYNGNTKLSELTGNALKFYYSGTLRTQMDTDGVKIYDGSTLLAKYTTSGTELYQGSAMVAKYTGNRISFYYNGNEVFYIQQGKIYSVGDMELASDNSLKINTASSGTDYWSFNKYGLDLRMGSYQAFRIGKLTSLAASVFAGIFDYIQQSNAKNTTTIVSSWDHNDSLYMSYLLWEVEYIGSGHHTCLHPGSTGSYLGDPSYNWSKAYINEINGYEYSTGYGRIRLLPHSSYSTKYALVDYKQSNDTVYYWSNATSTIFNGELSSSSSVEIKHDIENMEDMGDKIDRLRPVTFVYNEDPEEKKHYGLIYEETEPVIPEICSENWIDDKSNKALNYVELVPILLKEIQDLRARVKALEER